MNTIAFKAGAMTALEGEEMEEVKREELLASLSAKVLQRLYVNCLFPWNLSKLNAFTATTVTNAASLRLVGPI